MDIKVEEMEGMSQEELEALEDQVVEEEATESLNEPEAEPEKTPEKEPESKPEAVDDSEDEPAKEPEKEPVVEDPPEDEITKHISPPSKYIAKRIAAKEAKEKAAKFDETQTELDELKEKFSWLESQAKSKGIDVEKMPIDALSTEKIEEVREEYGDELADMFHAVKSLQGDNKQPVAKQEPKEEPADKFNPEQDQAPDNIEMSEAIENNHELSYWQQASPKLWERAVAQNGEWLKDPNYLSLSFDERFAHVVKQVKADVLEEAKNTVPEKQDDGGKPPESLSGTGSAPTIKDNDDVLSQFDGLSTEDFNKKYLSLSQEERDKVDMAIDI